MARVRCDWVAMVCGGARQARAEKSAKPLLARFEDNDMNMRQKQNLIMTPIVVALGYGAVTLGGVDDLLAQRPPSPAKQEKIEAQAYFSDVMRLLQLLQRQADADWALRPARKAAPDRLCVPGSRKVARPNVKDEGALPWVQRARSALAPVGASGESGFALIEHCDGRTVFEGVLAPQAGSYLAGLRIRSRRAEGGAGWTCELDKGRVGKWNRRLLRQEIEANRCEVRRLQGFSASA